MREYAIQYEFEFSDGSKKWVCASRVRGVNIPYMRDLDAAQEVMAQLEEAGKKTENPTPVRLVSREVTEWEVVA